MTFGSKFTRLLGAVRRARCNNCSVMVEERSDLVWGFFWTHENNPWGSVVPCVRPEPELKKMGEKQNE